MTDPIDPVERRNREDERQVQELFHLDAQLDNKQKRLDQLAHRDPVGLTWFGDDDAWLDKRLANNE
jgi:hypothetical protein